MINGTNRKEERRDLFECDKQERKGKKGGVCFLFVCFCFCFCFLFFF